MNLGINSNPNNRSWDFIYNSGTITRSLRQLSQLLLASRVPYTMSDASNMNSDSFLFFSHSATPEDKPGLFKVSAGKVNELLQAVMPLVSLKGVQELVPTISDIFMEQVKNNQHE